jgi:hypothetical protein
MSVPGNPELGLATLALGAAVILAGCGNAAHKQAVDQQPEPHASTAGARQVYPSAAPPGSIAPTTTPIEEPTRKGDTAQ